MSDRKKPHYIRKHVYGIIRDYESKVCSLFLSEDQAKRAVHNTLHHGHIVNLGLKGTVRTLTLKNDWLAGMINTAHARGCWLYVLMLIIGISTRGISSLHIPL